MRSLLTLFIISIFMINGVIAQDWKQNLPQNKVQNGTVTFQEIQQAFYQEYPADVVKDGKKLVDSKLEKIPGWKLFKRWEYHWETRIDLETGLFPSEEALAELSVSNANKTAISGGGNWSDMGPTYSAGGYAGLGRINTAAYHPTDNNTFWAGTAGGGLWKTTNGGTSWTVQTDNNDVLGVSAIAIPSDYSTSNTIIIGTGDKDASDNNSIGILKSTDGGMTWGTTSLSFSIGAGEQVCRIIIHPTNDQIMLAATTDGIYKSMDGGDNWIRRTGTSTYRDMEYKPGDPNTVYASNTSAFYRSTNGGDTWSTVQNISGSGIEICVSAAQPTWVYALVVNGSGGLAGIYKSTNSGASYSNVFSGGTGNALMGYYCDGSGDNGGQGWYDRCIAVNPTDANELFIGGINTWKSTNGGTTWVNNNMWTSYSGYNPCGSPEVHADKHYLGFQNGTSTLFEGNDGGLYKTTNGGTSWTHLSSGMSISQMYKLGVSQTVATETITGLQDNGTKLFSGNSWSDVKGGDGMECLIDYTNVNVQYGTYVNGQLDRTTNHWGSSTDISDNISGGPDGAWVSPYVIDPVNNQTLYMGYADVWKTTNRGNSWSKISTMNTSSKLRAMAIAPSNNQVLYVSDPNQIWKTTNGGTSWSEITGTLPVGSSSITYIAVKSDDPNTLWVTFGQYNNTKVYQSTNGGASWTNISAGLPSIPVNSVVQNIQNINELELYVATDVGVYQKTGTNNWSPYSTNLPNVKVAELEIYYDLVDPTNSKLKAATYGRGLWESELPALIVCTAPTNQANNFNATAIGDNQMTVNWTRGNGDRVVVLAHADAPVSFNPSNGDSYTASANALFGNGVELGSGNYVVYDGTGTNVTVTGLATGTAYHYSIFEYASVDNCYLRPGLAGNATTTGAPPCSVCDDVTSGSDDGSGVTLFSFNTINNTSSGDPEYTDYTTISTTVTQGASHDIAVNVNTAGSYTVNTKVWIDWNQNCDFTDAGEEYDLGSASSVSDGASSLSPLSITIPGTALIGNTILRVRATYNTAPTPCGNQSYSEAEDYTINVLGAGPAPVAEFTGTPTTICEGSIVTFSDASSENPTAWAWAFGDGGTSSLQNPTHTYNVAGDYTVVLTAINSNGSDSETKTNYITVAATPNAGTNETLTVCEGTSPTDAELFAALGGSPDNIGSWSNVGFVYTYTVNAIAPCAGSATATITLVEQVTPNAGTDGTLTICEGIAPTDTELFAVLGGSPDNTGSWSNVGLVYTYTVNATTPCTGSATSIVTLTEQTAPNAGTSGTLTVCEGTTPTETELFAVLGGTPATTGTWSNTGLVYSYTVTGIAPCGDAVSTVTVIEEAAPDAGTNGTLTICEGTSPTDTELLAALGGTPASTGTWSNVDLVYTYTVNAIAPCTGTASSTVTLAFDPLPQVSFTINTSSEPYIYFTNTSNNADSYSWNFGDGTTETTTDAAHEYTNNNTYTVVLSATNGCGTVSTQQDVIITNIGITSLGEESIKIFPNPTETILNISLPIRNVNIELVSLDGKVLRTIETKDAKNIEINVEDLVSGFYNLVLTSEDGNQVIVKVVKK